MRVSERLLPVRYRLIWLRSPATRHVLAKNSCHAYERAHSREDRQASMRNMLKVHEVGQLDSVLLDTNNYNVAGGPV